MSKPETILSSLLNATLQGVLAATVLRPSREWYLSDLAAYLKVRPSSLQRPLAKLIEAGILLRRESGNRVYYRSDPACPIFHELASILTKTTGLAEPLREALARFGDGIQAAFIHGSIAQGRERSESDVDLIIIGDAPSFDLTLALRPPSDRIGRKVNFSRYSREEFAAKVTSGHHFLTAVLRKQRIFLIGGELDLDKAAGRKTRDCRADEPERVG